MSQSSDLTGEFRLRTESVSMERLDGEVIAIDFSTGKYFSFMGTAADLIWLLEQEIPRSEWITIASDSFTSIPDPETFEENVQHLLGQLDQLELIEPAESLSGNGTALPDDYPRADWVRPEILANDDLVDLIVIDPIHDVSDDGWPAAKSND